MQIKDFRQKIFFPTIVLAVLAPLCPTISAKRYPVHFKRVAVAYRTRAEKIKIDGKLDEKIWNRLPGISNFIQHEPQEGALATQKSFVQIAYDNEALYVAFRAYDSNPNSIKKYLTRRDRDSPSDWVGFAVDSYHDRRTAFTFLVNPANVKIDIRLSNDNVQDLNWDAIWDVATHIYSNGWVAEFRIPYNQLRFPKEDSLSWGFQAMRVVSRINEISYWSPRPKDAAGFVSLFGTLKGLNRVHNVEALQILPYAMATSHKKPQADTYPQIQNPLNSYDVGGDIKYPFPNNLTLDMTINPDYGQVESDPSEFNLTAYETYFDEKRPFFLEGSNLFNYKVGIGTGKMSGGQLFYSRRIGRIPHTQLRGSPTIGVEQPPSTAILGAAKISGRTKNGWSIGILNAMTKEEQATIYEANTKRQQVVEPLSNYFVSRIQHDFNQGRTVLGCMATNVYRQPGSDLAKLLPRTATTGGIDLTHKWEHHTYEFNLSIMGSDITGDTLAMQKEQLSSARYYQRPDAEHLKYDPKRTSLAGFAGRFNLRKVGTGHWKWAVGGVTRSPGFEINDIGFMQTADFNSFFVWLGYNEYTPGIILRTYSVSSKAWKYFDYSATPTGSGIQFALSAQFLNYWSFQLWLTRNQQNLDTGLLRGGPAFLLPAHTDVFYQLQTDNRKPLQITLNGTYGKWESRYSSWSFSPAVLVRPIGRFDFSVSLNYASGINDLQYIPLSTKFLNNNYILGRLDRSIFYSTIRANLTLTPNLTLQYYGMPYITVGHYLKFHTVKDPRAPVYRDRIQDAAVPWNNDFNYRQFRSNLVLRWEYKSGSTFYFVWSQGITSFERYGQFNFADDAHQLFNSPSENIFLVKITRWLNF